MRKIELDDSIWGELGIQNLPELINEFEKNPEVDSEIFYELVDCIWDAGTCEPAFFAAIPHLIDIASKLEFCRAKDLWSYLGSWISTHKKYCEEVPEEILDMFYSSLRYAEKVCIESIFKAGKLSDIDAVYLYAGLFAFSKHDLGYMTMSGYKDDLEGTSVAKCENGHLNDVTVYNSGIVAYEEKELPSSITAPDLDSINYHFEKRDDNPWLLFEEGIQKLIKIDSISKEIKAHLRLSELIVKHGVKPDLPVKYAFSLYGSLLLCNGSIDESNRIFHGWDKIICQECGQEFIFADGWCESCL